MRPLELITKYYASAPEALAILVEHSEAVAEKSLALAGKVAHLKPDREFIYEAAMLHDIGILYTDSPKFGCLGDKPYICHGYLGRELLEREGLTRHALAAERHIGVGLSVNDIVQRCLPLPHREMRPITIEEKIVCFADCFFTKKQGELRRERSIEEVRAAIVYFGEDKLAVVDEFCVLFGIDRGNESTAGSA